MNYTTAVFLINKNVRAITATYEADTGAKRTMFKTLDDTIKVDDFVIVPTDTRHGMTVVKVTETDIDIDIDSTAPVLWVVEKIDRTNYNLTVAQEATAIQAIKSAEMRKKREDLASSLLANSMDAIKALPISMSGDPKPAEPAT